MTKTERNRMDREFSLKIRSRGKCQWPGCNNTAVNSQLQTAHIYSRRYLKLRWDEDNALCLCAKHHMEAHHSPLVFRDVVYKLLGPEKCQRLLDKRNDLSKEALK
jgi:hypothetical protein